MIKHLILTLSMIFGGMFFTGCVNNKTIINYTINENNEVVVVYESGDYETLEPLDTFLKNKEYSIFPSKDGFYIINGIKSTINLKTYDVTFISNIKDEIIYQKVKWRDKIIEPNVNNAGFLLEGWYNGDKKWDFNSNTVEENIILKAKWIANSYKIFLKEERPTDSLPLIFKTNEQYILPKLEKNGKNFLGWKLNDKLVPLKGTFNYAKDITLLAAFSDKELVVNFDSLYDINVEPIIYEYNKTIESLPTLERSGYEFLGWYCDDVKITLPYKLGTSNLNLKAMWTEIK